MTMGSGGGGKPIILYYVTKIAESTHKRSITLSGQAMDPEGAAYVRKAKKASMTVMCPMYELEKELRDQHRHDPGET